MSATALRCQEVVELVTDYFEHALPPSERARFDAHIAGCDGCTAYLEQMRTTIALTGRLRAEEVPEGSVEPLLEAFRDWRRARG
jgi:anti-sigma factor RsiW